MATTFYPFVENSGCSDDSNIAQPSTSARIAVYDDMSMPPRVVLVEPSDITSYLSNITQTVYELVSQKCDEWPFMVIRELVENYIHALFIEPSISILDKGRTIVFSDQGPGIANKEASRGVGFSSATPAMKKYIRGVGSGFPIVENHMKTHNGSIRIEDNLGHGTIVTVSLGDPASTAPTPQTAAAVQPAQGLAGSPAGYPHPNAAAPLGAGYAQAAYAGQQPYGYPQNNGGYAPLQGYPNPSYAQPAGYPNPYGQPAAWPQQPGAMPPQPMGAQYPGYTTYGMPNNGGYNPYQNQPAMPPQGYPSGYPTQAQPQQQPWGSPSGTGTPAEPVAPSASGMGAHVPLTSEERDILRVFGLTEKVGPTELNKRLGISAATGSRKLGDLAKAGYVTKNGQKYVLTGEGERVLLYLTNGEV